MGITQTSGNMSGALPTLSMLQRHHAIQYRSEDGTQGETAYPINYREVYNLKGRLLTLIDATFTDPQQRKAHKDVVWQTVQHWMNDVIRDGGQEPGGVTHHNDGDPLP